MTEIAWEGDIKLEVMNTDVEGRQKCKRYNEQLTWDLKKIIREQIKDWKNIHAEQVTVEKMKKKKSKRRTIRTLFIFISVTFELGTDACFLLYYFVEIVLLKILLLSSTWGGAAQ